MDLITEYKDRYPLLKEIANEIQTDLWEVLNNTPRIDNVVARAKSVERFLGKVHRKQYDHPLQDIQDQIGARVVVFYKSDVEVVATHILSEYRIVEDVKKEASEPDKFGYEAQHYVCFIPPEIRTRTNSPIQFFELQVSTLFQHAWAEAEHDLGYKSGEPLGYDEKRKIALAGAQAWGADLMFDDLWQSLSSS